MRLPLALLGVFFPLVVGDMGATQKPAAQIEVIPVGCERRLITPGGGYVKQVIIADEKLLRRVETGSHAYVVLRGLAPGRTRVTVTGQDGKREVTEVLVRREVTLPAGVTRRLRRSDQRPIRAAVSSDDKVCRVQPASGAPAVVYLDGRAPGDCHVTLTDAQGEPETYEVSVRRAQLLIPLGDLARVRSENAVRIVVNEREEVVRVGPLGTYYVGALGRAVGVSELVITDVEGKRRVIEVGVRPYGSLALPAGIRYRLRMYKTQPVRKATTGDERLARVRPVPGDPRSVEIETRAEGTRRRGPPRPSSPPLQRRDRNPHGGQGAGPPPPDGPPYREGTTPLTLVGEDGTVERYDLVVRVVPLLLSVGEKTSLRLSTGKKIADVQTAKLLHVEGGGGAAYERRALGAVRLTRFRGDPTSVESIGLRVGLTEVTLVDSDDQCETFLIGVTPAVGRDAP